MTEPEKWSIDQLQARDRAERAVAAERPLTARQRENLAFVIGRLEGYADGLDVRGFQRKREETDFARTLRAEAATVQRVLDGSDEEPTGFPKLLQSDREEAER